MKTRRKALTPKQRWELNRARYTWYLRLPYRTRFDRNRWWQDQSEIEPAAALYELVRRHPLVRESWCKHIATLSHGRRGVDAYRHGRPVLWFNKLQLPVELNVSPSLHWTCHLALKSWVNLDYTDRRNWEASAGALKGIDLRWEELQCRCVNELAEWRINDQREFIWSRKLGGKPRGRKIGTVNSSTLANKPPTAREWEAAIRYRAIEAHRQGYLLLAVAPDLEVRKAAAMMEKAYRSARRKYSKPKQRARWHAWLSLIAAFEDGECAHGRRDPRIFAHYRRAMDGVRFT